MFNEWLWSSGGIVLNAVICVFYGTATIHIMKTIRRDDAILGMVRTCPGCSEEWPLDAEFWNKGPKRSLDGFDARCRACSSERD